jgi:predicted small secreted protein
MKKIVFIALVAGSLAGCGTDPITGKPTVAATIDLWSSPKAGLAVGNVGKLARAISCGVTVTTAQLAQSIVGIIGTDKAAIDDAGKAYAISVAVCNTISGIVAAN